MSCTCTEVGCHCMGLWSFSTRSILKMPQYSLHRPLWRRDRKQSMGGRGSDKRTNASTFLHTIQLNVSCVNDLNRSDRHTDINCWTCGSHPTWWFAISLTGTSTIALPSNFVPICSGNDIKDTKFINRPLEIGYATTCLSFPKCCRLKFMTCARQ